MLAIPEKLMVVQSNGLWVEDGMHRQAQQIGANTLSHARTGGLTPLSDTIADIVVMPQWSRGNSFPVHLWAKDLQVVVLCGMGLLEAPSLSPSHHGVFKSGNIIATVALLSVSIKKFLSEIKK